MYKWKKRMKNDTIVSSDSSCASSSISSINNEERAQSPAALPPLTPPSPPTKMKKNEFASKIIIEKEDRSNMKLIRSVSNNTETDRNEYNKVPRSQNLDENGQCPTRKRRKISLESSPVTEIKLTGSSSERRLLATSNDEMHLNALHCLVRQNIQVFTASPEDINVPAPGRKSRIYLGQVGLRCIHCQNVPGKKRVKRAICYPSSVSRVYHSVSDMKFDHFSACKSMPQELKEKFMELKRLYKKRSTMAHSTSSTAQYYFDSARSLGMVDFLGGIFMKSDVANHQGLPPNVVRSHTPFTSRDIPSGKNFDRSMAFVSPNNTVARFLWNNQFSLPYKPKCLQTDKRDTCTANGDINKVESCDNGNRENTKGQDVAIARNVVESQHNPKNVANKSGKGTSSHARMSDPKFVPTISNSTIQHNKGFNVEVNNQERNFHAHKQHNQQRRNTIVRCIPSIQNQPSAKCQINPDTNVRTRLLGLPDDNFVLNPLHCFVRRNTEIFTASLEDIAAPSPGRKQKVAIGQVGLRCIHCAHLPIKERVKRAVCYPPTVGGIYHCVSNMKFDHFGACRGMPDKLKAEFMAFKKACTRKGSGGSNGSIFTAHYYQSSALKIGLVDSDAGIRWRGQQEPLADQQKRQHLQVQVPEKIDGKRFHSESSLASAGKHDDTNHRVHPLQSANSGFPSTNLKFPKSSPSMQQSEILLKRIPSGGNDGLSALMIAATERSNREKEAFQKDGNNSNVPFAPLSSPGVLCCFPKQ